MGAEDAKVIDIPLAGMSVSGDLAAATDGTSPFIRNIVTRPGGEFYAREPYRHEGPKPVNGVAQYHPLGFIEDWPRYSVKGAIYFETDTVNAKTAAAWVYTQNILTLVYDWSKLVMPAGILATDATEYQGLMCFSALRASGATPSSIDAVKIAGPALTTPEHVFHVLEGGVELYGNALSVFGDRLVIGNILRYITNLIGQTYGADAMYGVEGDWVENGTTFTSNTDTSFIAPNATSGVATYTLTDIVAFSSDDPDYFITADMFNTDPVNEMPITVEAFISGPVVARTTAYAVGAIIVVGGYLYICTTAGTTAGSAPSYNTTAGTFTTDGTAVFKNMGADTIEKFEIILAPAASASGIWSQAAMAVNYSPVEGQEASLGVRFRFGTVARTTWPTSAVKIGYKDGKSTNDPTKANKGIQITKGTVPAQFVQSDTEYTTVETQTSDTYWWTEPGTFEIMPLNHAKLSQAPGEITAICAPVAGRMIMYKRNMATVFQLSSDVNLPFSEERTLIEYGCANTRAWDVFEDVVYTVSQYEVYSFDGSGMPQPLCGTAMRDAVFARAGLQVPQSDQRIGIDREKREVHVYTQRNSVFVYNIDTRQWSVRSVHPNGVANMTVGDFCWAYDRFMTVSSPSGILSRGPTEVVEADTDLTGTSHVADFDYWIPQLGGAGELTVLIEKLHLHYRSTQTSDFKVEISRNGGATWTVLLSGLAPAAVGQRAKFVQIPVWASGEQPWIRLHRVGAAGKNSFYMVGLKAYLQLLGETVPAENAAFTVG